MQNHSKTNRFENHSKTVFVIIVVLVVLVSDLVLTGIYHIQKYGTIHKYADRRALREQSPVFHHTLKPNGHQTEQKWGHLSSPFYTNSLGFKDRKIRDVPLTTSQYRFLFIGDSFTEGIGFEYEKTFVGHVDAALAPAGIEVLNAAVSSYSPILYFKKVEHLLETVGLDFEHLIVFLDISDIEDEVKRYELRDGRVVGLMEQTSKMKEFVYEYTGLMKNIWTLSLKLQKAISPTHEGLRSQEERQYGINQKKSLWTIDDKVFQAYGREGLVKAQHYMGLLHQLLLKHQKEMTLAVYPWPDQIVHEDLHSRQVIFWQDWANQHSVTFFDFFPVFISSESDAKDVLSKNFIEGDVHWNERGHERIAHELLKKMRDSFSGVLHDQEVG
ncbi:MAG: hypothetical protein ACPGYT_04560 [Nitrospirales bacterium]